MHLTQNEINLLYTEEINEKSVFAKQKCDEAGCKALKILARRLQKERADNTIYKMKDTDSGTELFNQKYFKKTI